MTSEKLGRYIGFWVYLAVVLAWRVTISAWLSLGFLVRFGSRTLRDGTDGKWLR